MSVNELISAIVARSALASTARRHEIARELWSHIEDAAEEAREAGYDEDEVERLVLCRFGDPQEVARQLARTYRNESIVFRVANLTALAISCVLAVAAIICAAQAAMAVMGGIPISKAFPRLGAEVWGFAFVALGYLFAWRGENWFGTFRLLKTAISSCVFLIAAGGVLFIIEPGHKAAPLAAFAGAAGFRLLRRVRPGLFGFAGVTIPMLLGWMLAGPIVIGNGRVG